MGKNHTLAELEAAIIEKGLQIEEVMHACYIHGTLDSITILSSYREPDRNDLFFVWDIKGECYIYGQNVRYPELDLFK